MPARTISTAPWTGCSPARTRSRRSWRSGTCASGGLALYDLTSSYFEGSHCPLAKRGYNRDGKKGKLQVNYGLLTDARGCPVAVSVFEGNTADPATLLPQADKLRQPVRPAATWCWSAIAA